MQLLNRNLLSRLSRTATVTLLLLATSTMLYAKAPDNPGGGGDTSTCTISPDTTTITEGQTILFSSSTSGLKGKKTYLWDFKGGSPSASSNSSVSVTYGNGG